ncbi:hypothetical protein UFOVP1325_34 [uncultured Caudovirales phage]|uniref:Uncharacterized protein n=1 Tax=uncultured Caudovirales phage TaxID=2100421 RepID=A0A6J5RXL0_9CAUD|nr:hypothetical protein UFOVP1325_34 [uncultured Caudovirales phage]CAB4212837.1 hypothetical protein UFOVP1435_37 [uncultured Caudovirales phage]CAB5227977.1 hypothetical protein UFOVP1530_27 [uncultured Caudovirales phage]
MRIFLVIAALLVGCSSDKLPAPEPVGDLGDLVDLGSKLDNGESRAAAAVIVAQENLDKPPVAKAELDVAKAYMIQPTPGDLSLARERAKAADAKAYTAQIDEGKKLTTQIEAEWAKAEAKAKANEAAMIAAQAEITRLKAEADRAAAESSRQIWTLTGAGLACIGGLVMMIGGIKMGAPILLASAFCASIPYITDSPFFAWIMGAFIFVCAALGAWWLFDRVRDSVNNNEPPDPANK